MKFTDKANGLFTSPSFDFILTRTLSEEINSQLNAKYGDTVHVSFDRPGAFSVEIDNKDASLSMPDLEQTVYSMVLASYGEAYQKAKETLANIENINIREVS
tara:strand:+ start:592 stop:897 length:306 start_codon:yes stop_codon:yes gene_type:complete